MNATTHHAAGLSERTARVTTFELVFPEHTNPHGAAFGGYVLGLMDKVGSYAAARHARSAVVTVAVSEVVFKVPIKSGDLLELVAEVSHVGNSSIGVHVDVYRERFGGNPDARQLATHGFLTFVAIDADGAPRPVPRKTGGAR